MMRRLRRAAAVVALAFVVGLQLLPCAALAEESLQGALENAQPDAPEGFGRTTEVSYEWPRRPRNAEIDAAKKLFDQGMDGAVMTDDGWVKYKALTVTESRVQKMHPLSGKPELGGDKDTGDQVFVEYTGVGHSGPPGAGGNLPVGQEPGQAQADWPSKGVRRLIYNKTDSRFQFDTVLAKYRTDTFNDLYGNGWANGWASEGADDSGADTPLPWKTVGGGAAAVAAAATAMAGALARTSQGKRTRRDPKRPIGYVLQLSSQQLRLSAQQSAPLDVAVWQVMPDGRASPAEDARITLSPPEGASVRPADGAGRVSAVVWQTGAMVAGGETLTVTASSAAGGGARATVALTPAEETRLEVAFEPADKTEIVANGRHGVTLTARVAVSPDDAAAPGFDAPAVRASIAFASAGQWLDLSEAADWGTDGRAVRVQASQPDPDHPVQPPESQAVRVSAQLGARRLEATAVIALARNPEIDANPDTVEFSAESGETAEVSVWIDHGGGAEWTFRTAWRDGSQPLAKVETEQTGPTTLRLTLTEDAKDKLDPARPEDSATLRVLASAEGFDELERYVKVIVSQEGLYVDRTGRDNDGTFHIRADGEGKPTDIDVRVYTRDAEGKVALDEQASYDVEWKPASTEGSAGAAALAHDDLQHESAGIRELNVNAAIHRFTYPRVLPTDGRPVPATIEASVPGFDKPSYTKLVSISLAGPATLPYTDAWFKERDACLKIIAEFVPAEAQQKFRDIVYQRGKTLGAEGLYEMRKRFWEYARNALMAEHEDYMYEAWKWEQAEGLADWISWCCDIAVGVATGTLVGTSAALAIGVIKPSLVSAMDVWTKGGSIDDWAREQLGVGIGTLEGVATDIDLLVQKVPGGKAAAWCVFICYWFVRELMRDPDMSVKNAMVNVCRMVRDQALITFLRGAFGTKPGVHVTEEGTHPASKPLPERPAGRRPDGLDAPPPQRPPKGRAPKSGEKPAEPKGRAPKAGDKPPTSTEKPPAKPAAPETRAPGDKKPKPPPPVKPGKTMGGPAAVELVNANTTMKNGKPHVDIETMSRIMRDPDAAREMRRTNPEAYQAYENTRAEVRAAHDAELAQHIKNNVPGMKDKNIRVQTVGTEGGIDRDYHVQMEVPDPRNPGKTMWIEVPKEQWQAESHRIFAEQTGGPKDPAEQAKWAHEHQQVGGDSYIGEAAVDMAGEATVKGPDGKPVRVQIEPRDRQVMNTQPGHAGEPVKLYDPDGYGKTWETKVAESSKGGALDGYAQAKKAVDTLDKVRQGYENQNLKVGDLPPDFEKGAKTVRMVAEGKLSVEEGNAALRNMKLGDLQGFMGKVSAQFGALKWAK